jgi:hypothetical protein
MSFRISGLTLCRAEQDGRPVAGQRIHRPAGDLAAIIDGCSGAGALRRHFADALEFRVPEGGMALWLRADESINVADWVQAGEREGVSFDGGQCYDVLASYSLEAFRIEDHHRAL